MGRLSFHPRAETLAIGCTVNFKGDRLTAENGVCNANADEAIHSSSDFRCGAGDVFFLWRAGTGLVTGGGIGLPAAAVSGTGYYPERTAAAGDGFSRY